MGQIIHPWSLMAPLLFSRSFSDTPILSSPTCLTLHAECGTPATGRAWLWPHTPVNREGTGGHYQGSGSQEGRMDPLQLPVPLETSDKARLGMVMAGSLLWHASYLDSIPICLYHHAGYCFVEEITSQMISELLSRAVSYLCPLMH